MKPRGPLAAALAAPLSASAAIEPVMLPIRISDNGFNTGNDALSMSAFLKSGAVILDELPPHAWSGPNVIAAWIKDLTAHNKDSVTNRSVSMNPPQVETSNGVNAYVVSPVVCHYKQHGMPMHEPATMTFALKKVGNAWFIVGLTWNGTVRKPGRRRLVRWQTNEVGAVVVAVYFGRVLRYVHAGHSVLRNEV